MGNPYLTGFPWAAALNYVAPTFAWNGQPTKVLPLYSAFQPAIANAPTAQELDYILNQRDNAILWNATHGLLGITNVVATGFAAASPSSVDFTGLTLSLVTNPGDLLVLLMSAQANGNNGLLTCLEKDGAGAFASPNMAIGATTGGGNGCANGGAVGFVLCGGTNGQTSVVKGQAASLTGTTTYYNATITVLQFRP